MTAAYQPGDTLGRYKIERLVGSGAMGEVYLARDPQIDRRLAVKTLRLVGVPEGELEERQQRMLREARTAGKLIHPHIVTLFDAGEQDGVLFLAFEFVAGSDLSVRLKQGPLSIGDALAYARQACEGLGHAHRQGIVHRDVKPSNLMLDADGRIKISDFGIAKLSGEATTELTMTGMVMGSPHYMAPEQVRGEELDGRSDLFSLGIVLYEMVCGRRPFEGETISTLVYQILGAEPPPLPPLRSGLVPQLPDLLGRMLAKDRAARYPDAASAATAIRAVEATLSPELARMPATRVAAPTDATVVMDSGDQPSAGAALPPTVTPAMGTPATPPTAGSAPAPGAVPPPPPAGVGPASGGSYAVPALPAAQRKRTWLLVAAAVAALVVVGALGLFVLSGLLPAGGGGQVAELGAGAEAAPDEGDEPGGKAAAGEVEEPLAGAARNVAPPPAGDAAPRPRTTTESRTAGGPEGSPGGERPAAAGATTPRTGTGGGTPPGTGSPATAAPSPTPPRADAEPPVRARRDEPAAAVPEPARREPAPSRPPFTPDATVDSGMAIGFDVFPPDAFVLVDGTVIGQVKDYGRASRQAYTLPSAGEHRVTLRRDGMADHEVLVRASAGGPAVTPIRARLRPLSAEEVPLGDLEMIRVKKAIAFRVDPPAARLMVDGEAMGVANRFRGGRFAGRDNWLELPLGMHRVSLVAPGRQRVDYAVDVTSGADEERHRIEVTLPPLAAGGDG